MAQGASGRGLALTLARDDLRAPALTTGGRLLCRRDAAVSGAVGIRAGARSEGARGGTRACYAHDSRASRCLAGRKAVPTLGPRQLAVRPEEVVQLVEASDGRLVAEGAVGSSSIVEVDPPGEGGGALAAVAVDRAIGPATEHGADESLCLAIGLRAVGACA